MEIVYNDYRYENLPMKICERPGNEYKQSSSWKNSTSVISTQQWGVKMTVNE